MFNRNRSLRALVDDGYVGTVLERVQGWEHTQTVIMGMYICNSYIRNHMEVKVYTDFDGGCTEMMMFKHGNRIAHWTE